MFRLKRIHIGKKTIGLAIACVALVSASILLQPAAAKVGAFAEANLERKLPIYCVQTEEAKVSVSFDAAWGADDTDELLRILSENEVIRNVTFRYGDIPTGVFSGYTKSGKIWYLKKHLVKGFVSHEENIIKEII